MVVTVCLDEDVRMGRDESPFRPLIHISPIPDGYLECRTYSCYVLLFHTQPLCLGNIRETFHVEPISLDQFCESLIQRLELK